MSTNSCKPANDRMTNDFPVTSHQSLATKNKKHSIFQHTAFTGLPYRIRASDKTKSTPSPAGGDQQRAVADLAWGFIGSFSPTRGILCLFCVLAIQVAQVSQVAQVAQDTKGSEGSEGSQGSSNVPLTILVISTDPVCA